MNKDGLDDESDRCVVLFSISKRKVTLRTVYKDSLLVIDHGKKQESDRTSGSFNATNSSQETCGTYAKS